MTDSLLRVLSHDDSFCPHCGHNRDHSSVSSIDHGDYVHSCQMCGIKWKEPDARAAAPAQPSRDDLLGFIDAQEYLDAESCRLLRKNLWELYTVGSAPAAASEQGKPSERPLWEQIVKLGQTIPPLAWDEATTDPQRVAVLAAALNTAKIAFKELERELAALTAKLAAVEKDALAAASIGMAFMISHLGAYEEFSEYQKSKWEILRLIHTRAAPAGTQERG